MVLFGSAPRNRGSIYKIATCPGIQALEGLNAWIELEQGVGVGRGNSSATQGRKMLGWPTRWMVQDRLAEGRAGVMSTKKHPFCREGVKSQAVIWGMREGSGVDRRIQVNYPILSQDNQG